MNLTVDTSIIIAVITNARHKKQLIKATRDVDLIAPSSLHWEIGNAFSAMFKRKKINIKQAFSALEAYHKISLRFSDIELGIALELSNNLMYRNFNYPPIIPPFTGGNRGVATNKVAEGLIKIFMLMMHMSLDVR